MRDVEGAVDAALAHLVAAQHWKDASFVNLPLVYPSGSSVAVKIDQQSPDSFRISDSGFAYRELESVGAQRSFGREAARLAENDGIERDARTLFVKADRDDLVRAICDVGVASWRLVDKIFERVVQDFEQEIEDNLRERLTAIFGAPKVEFDRKITGSSSTEWDVTALVKEGSATTVFQAVGQHANSIYRASTAFHDLAALEMPPHLVSVVKNKSALGSRLTLLSQASHVIQNDQSDAVFRRLAA